MVDVSKLKKGDKVYYQPEHYKENNKFENGIVKSIALNGGVFVVYKCNNEWHKFEDFTAGNTRPEDLYLGWKSFEAEKSLIDDFDHIYETNFHQFADYLKCKYCGERIERGIASVSYHWIHCLTGRL